MTAVEATGVWKAFDGTLALRGADLAVEPGSIHALMGENGAGKSTLIKVITGVHHADRGTIRLDGRECRLTGVRDAIAEGVGAVYQERNLIPAFSVAENLFLHDPAVRAGFLQYGEMYRAAEPWLKRVGLELDPRTPARALSVAQGQLVEIARALAVEARLLLLDEPTASITQHEAGALFQALRELRDQGTAVLFVSHKLEEVLGLCDRITVLRDGETVLAGEAREQVTREDLIAAMVGRNVDLAARHVSTAEPEGAPALELRGVSTDVGHEDVDLALPPGRVVGLYGLVGAGRTELARAIVGIAKVTGGELLRDGEPVRVKDPHDALQRHRIGYVSEDRKGEGLILEHSVRHNAAVAAWDKIKGRLGYMTGAREQRAVLPALERLHVTYHSLGQPVGQLSGGNQQKVSVAKWLVSDVDLLILDEPTIGVDVRTKEEMYLLVEELARRGIAVLMISSDLPEVIRIADRILVMAEREIVAEIDNDGDYDTLSRTVMEAIVDAQTASSAGVES